ncbi:MAG: hypothetical protein ABW156_05820 [Jiangellaceae bacterium]
MVQLITPEELASYLQQDLDASTANQAINTASAYVESKTGMAFTPRTATVRLPASTGLEMSLPVRPVTAVASVTIDGTSYADYALTADGTVYRARSWRTAMYPQIVQMTIQYGCAQAPNDIKGVVTELSGGIYDGRLGVQSEAIDDHRVSYSGVLSAVSVQTLANYGADIGSLSMTGR